MEDQCEPCLLSLCGGHRPIPPERSLHGDVSPERQHGETAADRKPGPTVAPVWKFDFFVRHRPSPLMCPGKLRSPRGGSQFAVEILQDGTAAGDRPPARTGCRELIERPFDGLQVGDLLANVLNLQLRTFLDLRAGRPPLNSQRE